MTDGGKYFQGWRESQIKISATIREALEAITRCGAMMACVVADNGRLEGILTDSDIRRAMLKGARVEDPIAPWINTRPLVGRADAEPLELVALAKKRGIREIPLIAPDGSLSDIFVLLVHQQRQASPSPGEPGPPAEVLPNPMLILAGGLGTRLRTVVNDRPKPLAMVGDKPILETLISRAATAGVRHFFVSVNYLSEQIEQHLSSSAYQGLNIKIVREQQRLGTAGSIGLIKKEINHPLLISNADVLTTAPFQEVLRSHEKNRADITCTVRPYHATIPFGVFDIEDGLIRSITEKPKLTYMVNAGIYVVSPELCRTVEANTALDMPDLIARAMQSGKRVAPFLLHEYWIDIGQPDDFHRANAEFDTHFSANPK